MPMAQINLETFSDDRNFAISEHGIIVRIVDDIHVQLIGEITDRSVRFYKQSLMEPPIELTPEEMFMLGTMVGQYFKEQDAQQQLAHSTD